MTILTITRKGTLRLPREVTKHLGDAKHLQIRLNAHGVTLMPVRIHSGPDLKAIPDGKAPQGKG